MGQPVWDFQKQLALWGPGSAALCHAAQLDVAEAYTRSVALTHYENFHVVSWLIPKALRQDFYNIYAYCRWSDDLADEAGSPARATELLDWWQSELDKCFNSQSNHPVMIAARQTAQKYRLPAAPFRDLLDAFRQDQRVTRYESAADVEDYCRRSANPVGRLVLGLAGAADDETNLRLSDSICTGLQLANFCQDMARDAALDRIYAPRELWRQYEVVEETILAARPTSPLKAMLKSWVETAREFLQAGQPLESRVPSWLRGDLWLFRNGGLAILGAIERQGYDVWTRRPVVTKSAKGILLLRALLARWGGK